MRVDLKAVEITGSDAEQATIMFLIDFRSKRKFNQVSGGASTNKLVK